MRFLILVLVVGLVAALPTSNNNSDDVVPDLAHDFVDVSKYGHMFYVFYGAQQGDRTKAPVILWLQGPGGSSTGFGNFGEVGPLDVSLQAREYSWNKKANLLFVDQPVGTGFSYVDHDAGFTKNQAEIDAQLLICVKAFYAKNPSLVNAPFYIFSESYGGKMTASFGVALHNAIQAKELSINFKGVALGDSWIDPLACMESYGPFLNAISEVTDAQQQDIDSVAATARKQIAAGQLSAATDSWGQQQNYILSYTGGVNFYNYMEHGSSSSKNSIEPYRALKQFITPTNDIPEDQLDVLMNNQIKKQWNIPSKVTWGGQSSDVFSHLAGDFMTDVVPAVDQLLSLGYKVVVYNGALDVIVDTPCVTAWMKQLKWDQMASFYKAARSPLHVNQTTQETVGFKQIYKNLEFWTLLKAGHMVPSDMPELATQMFESITEL